MAHKDNRDVSALGRKQQMRRDLANLTDAAWGGLKACGKNRLDRINDDKRRLQAFDLFEDPLEAGFGEQIERGVTDRQAFASQLDLMLRLFARAVEDGADIARDV